MQIERRYLIVLFVCAIVTATSVARAAPPSAASNPSASGGAPTSSQSSNTTNSVAFDLHDTKLNYPPAAATDPSKPSAAVFCFKAKQIDSATQPIIVASDASDNLDEIVSAARSAIDFSGSAIGYIEAYADLRGADGANLASTAHGKAKDTAKELHDMNGAAVKAADALQKRNWNEYELRLESIRRTAIVATRAVETTKAELEKLADFVAQECKDEVVDPTSCAARKKLFMDDLLAKAAAASAHAQNYLEKAKAESGLSQDPVSGYLCAHPGDVAPLLMGMELYIRIDFSEIPKESWPDLKLATLAVSAAAGSPINPTPVRAGISQPTVTVNNAGAPYAAPIPVHPQGTPDEKTPEMTKVYEGLLDKANQDLSTESEDRPRMKYLKWPYPLVADTSVSVSVSVLYTPPNSLAALESGRYYPVGSVVSIADVAVCYIAKSPVPVSYAAVNKSPDQDLQNWAPIPHCIAPTWSEASSYVPWDVVSVDSPVSIVNGIGSCYAAIKPISPSTNPPPDPGSGNWSVRFRCTATPWTASRDYGADDIVSFGPQACYVATTPDIPANEVAIRNGVNKWQKLANCPAAPASTTSEETVALINQTLPSVHALSRFNLTAGIVYNWNRTRSYGFQSIKSTTATTSAATNNNSCNMSTPTMGSTAVTMYSCVQTGSSPIIDPVLFFTYYQWPIDAERPFRWGDFVKPGFSLGVSLASPTSNFYVGFMHEIRRNVQFVWGFTAVKNAHLASNSVYNASPSAMTLSPITVQKFETSVYAGVSFNILGFVQSLTGGGGGGGGGGGAASTPASGKSN